MDLFCSIKIRIYNSRQKILHNFAPCWKYSSPLFLSNSQNYLLCTQTLVNNSLPFFQPFNNWLDGTREDLVDMFIVHTLDEIQGLIDAHAQFKATLGEADKEFQAIIALIHEVEGFAKQYNVPGANINPYTNLTGSVSLKLKSFAIIC